MRRLACGAAAVVTAFAIAAPAGGKEGMTATLLGHVPVAAKGGTVVRIAWRIGSQSASAASDDDRVYVRLRSARGGGSTRAFGHYEHRRYVASVRVPRGGIGRIQIFLVGWRMYPGGVTERADMNIPITNDPFSLSTPLRGARPLHSR